jgi:hypothetical protein
MLPNSPKFAQSSIRTNNENPPRKIFQKIFTEFFICAIEPYGVLPGRLPQPWPAKILNESQHAKARVLKAVWIPRI